MIVPSIDIQRGRAVQLRGGRELVLDGGDPLERLDLFAVAGEVAVVDLDAALGSGSNAEVVRRMCRRAPCRVGGGIRDVEQARSWLDAGATKVVLGTAATVETCSRLPRERVVAAVDARRGDVVVDGWRRSTGRTVVERVAELAPHVSGFLVTQVEHEGGLAGFDLDLVRSAVSAAGSARVTAAGGITRADEIALLDVLGADAQVGLALYVGRLSLGDAVAAPLIDGIDGLWPTVVCDESGRAMGLAWSSRATLGLAVAERRGIYWSRRRQQPWRKGSTSGAVQELLRVDLDCDRDALRFIVRQAGSGFCHTGEWGCWPESFGLATLARRATERLRNGQMDSGTVRLAQSPELLRAKLLEEAGELADTASPAEAVAEAADLAYFAVVALLARGGSLPELHTELEWRARHLTRRPMTAKRTTP